jgi:hypothetical protein
MSGKSVSMGLLGILIGLALGYGLSQMSAHPTQGKREAGTTDPVAAAAPEAAVPAAPKAGGGPNPLAAKLEALEKEKVVIEEESLAYRDEIAGLKQRVMKLEEEAGRRLSARPPVVSAPATADERGARARLGASVVDASGAISKQFAEEHKLTPDQQSRANEVLKRAQQQVRALELDNAVIKYASDNEVIVTVKNFSEAGQQVRKAMQEDLKANLPPEAFDSLVAGLNAGGVLQRSAVYNFGDATRDINIKINKAEDGTPSYTVRDTGSVGGSPASPPATFMSFGSLSGSGASATSSSIGLGSFQMTTSSGDGKGTYSRSLQTKDLPEEYRHFLLDGK